MGRAACGAVIVVALFTQVIRGQQPSGPASSPRAALGNPTLQPASSWSRPSAWETLPASRSSMPGSPVPAPYSGSYTTLPRPIYDQTAPSSSEPIGIDTACADSGDPWLDNLSLFVGLDGSKEPADLAVNANFGTRLAFQWGMPLMEEAGLGLQIGTALHHAQNTFPLFIDSMGDHWRSFSTVGLFQRTDFGLRWGVGYDFRLDDYFDTYSAGQWRGTAGFQVNPDNEIGIWGTLRGHDDTAFIGPLGLTVRPISQWNIYWRRVWNEEIVTRVWAGLAAGHGRFDLIGPALPPVRHPFTFGTDLYVPLSDNLALFGEAHFITPYQSGSITATLGVAWFPGSARGTARSRFAPLLPLANTTTFPLDAR